MYINFKNIDYFIIEIKLSKTILSKIKFKFFHDFIKFTYLKNIIKK